MTDPKAEDCFKRSHQVAKAQRYTLGRVEVMDLNSADRRVGIALDGEQIYGSNTMAKNICLNCAEKQFRKPGLKPEQIEVHLRFGNLNWLSLKISSEYENDLIVGSTAELFAKTGRWLCCVIRNSFGQMRRAGCAYKERRR